MGKSKQATKVVPKKLHAELVHYDSLLRVLRTEATQNASSPLVFASGPSSNPAGEEDKVINEYAESLGDLEDDEEDSQGHLSTAIISQGVLKQRRPRKRRKIEIETTHPPFPDITSLSSRWPHLVRETFVPEYTLRDEVEAIALSVLRSQPFASHVLGSESSDFQGNGDGEETDEDADADVPNTAVLPPAFASSLTQEISLLLTHIFALLAHHRPVAASSLQNRLAPIGWEGLLDIVGNGGMIAPSVLEIVRHRMKQDYGRPHIEDESGPLSVRHSRALNESRRALAKVEADLLRDCVPVDTAVPRAQTYLDVLLNHPCFPEKGSKKDQGKHKSRYKTGGAINATDNGGNE